MKQRLQAITESRRFQLGFPRNVTEIDHGRLLFLRSGSAIDPVHSLWQVDLVTGIELLLVDPATLVEDACADVPTAELDGRERRREYGEGIVDFSVDAAGRWVAFALCGRLFLLDTATGNVAPISTDRTVTYPRIDPTGQHIACASADDFVIYNRAGEVVVRRSHPDRVYGLAEFAAAEELGRQRGHWWSPDANQVLVTVVEETAVAEWWPVTPESPWAQPRRRHYPTAGCANATVSLEFVSLDGSTNELTWDREQFPYLVDVTWPDAEHLTITVMSRDQHEMRAIVVRGGDAHSVIDTQQDAAWVWLVPGTPAWLSDGRLLTARHADDTVSLFLDSDRITPPGLQVAAVVGTQHRVVFTASTEPIEQRVYAYTPTTGEMVELSRGSGIHDCVNASDVTVIVSESLETDDRAVTVTPAAGATFTLATHRAGTLSAPRVQMLHLGPRRLRAALVLPDDSARPSGPLPVLLDPYGGPLNQRVRASRRLFQEPQWFADLGCAVLVIDGRGSPSRGRDWERAFRGDVLTPSLADQVEGLEHAVELFEGEFDLTRVAMRGWSFGGYLSAAAVLRRPDVFAAAIAGAPVADWRWYDTVASERYLGDPHDDPAAYERTSLLAEAATLSRPLLLVHGLADDNVYPVHSFALADRMNAAQAPVRLVTLPGTTHVVREPATLRTLLMIQARFLHETIGVRTPGGDVDPRTS